MLLGQACLFKRTAMAPRTVDRRRDHPGVEECAKVTDGLECLAPQVGIKMDDSSTAGCGVVNASLPYGDIEHLLQAKCLRAELHVVIRPRRRLAAFVVHGAWFFASGLRPELDDVGAAREAKAVVEELHSAHRAAAAAFPIAGVICSPMYEITLIRELVPGEQALCVDERGASVTEQVVVEGRDGDKDSVVLIPTLRWSAVRRRHNLASAREW